MVIICGITTSIIYHKTIVKRNIIFYFGYILIIFALFSPLQGSEFGMAIQVRMGITFAFLTLAYSEKMYHNKSQSVGLKIILYILTFLSYFVFGTFYTFSWIVAITAVYLLRMIYGKINNISTPYKDYCMEIRLMLICVVVYFSFYNKIAIYMGLTENVNNIPIMIINLIKYIIISMGSITLPWDAIADNKISKILLYSNSIYVTIFTIVAVIIYCRTKMWEKTLLPLIMIFYTLATFSQIYFGRSTFGLFGAYNSWYNVHTKFLLAAVIMIYVYPISENISISFKSFIINPTIIRNISILFLLILLIPCIAGYVLFSKRKQSNKNWIESRMQYLIGVAELSVNNNGETELLYDYEGTIRGIELLKKYKLNVFHGDNIYNIINQNIIYSGFYEKDPSAGSWIKGDASIILANKTASHFSLEGYYPVFFPTNNITVTINSNESSTIDIVPGEPFNIELYFLNMTGIVNVSIRTNKTFIPMEEGWNEDLRELGAYINSWSISDEYVKYSGFYETESNGVSWINGDVSIIFVNKNTNHFSLNGYYPENWPSNNITVTINNNESITIDIIQGKSFNIELDFLNENGIVNVKIRTEKSFVPRDEGWNEEIRELGAIISSWSFSE